MTVIVLLFIFLQGHPGDRAPCPAQPGGCPESQMEFYRNVLQDTRHPPHHNTLYHLIAEHPHQIDNDGLETITIDVGGQTATLTLGADGAEVEVEVPTSERQNTSQDPLTVSYTGSVTGDISGKPFGFGISVSPSFTASEGGTIQKNHFGALWIYALYNNGGPMPGLHDGLDFKTWE